MESVLLSVDPIIDGAVVPEGETLDKAELKATLKKKVKLRPPHGVKTPLRTISSWTKNHSRGYPRALSDFFFRLEHSKIRFMFQLVMEFLMLKKRRNFFFPFVSLLLLEKRFKKNN